MDDIVVTTGDTDGVPYGIGAFASRLGALASSAVKIGATELREKIFRAAGALFEVAIEDLELADGTVRVKGSPCRAASPPASAVRCTSTSCTTRADRS